MVVKIYLIHRYIKNSKSKERFYMNEKITWKNVKNEKN